MATNTHKKKKKLKVVKDNYLDNKIFNNRSDVHGVSESTHLTYLLVLRYRAILPPGHCRSTLLLHEIPFFVALAIGELGRYEGVKEFR